MEFSNLRDGLRYAHMVKTSGDVIGDSWKIEIV